MTDPAATVEHVFSCIAQGNAARDRGAEWDAAAAYLDAYSGLRQLHETTKDGKVQRLYHQQSVEYYTAARACLIRALQVEEEEEAEKKAIKETATNIPPHEVVLPLEERKQRARLWQRFYHVPLPEEEEEIFVNADDDHSDIIDDAALPALERRLQQLRQALPSHLQSEQERDQQRQRQLQRLGIFTERSSSSTPTTTPMTMARPELTAAEQVQDIITQVREELSLEQPSPENATVEEEVVLQDEDDPVQALLATLAQNSESTKASHSQEEVPKDLPTEVAALLAQARQEGLLQEQDEEDELTPSDDDDSLEEELSREEDED
jgi:hypothetical protein